jgi:hypothetical protein
MEEEAKEGQEENQSTMTAEMAAEMTQEEFEKATNAPLDESTTVVEESAGEEEPESEEKEESAEEEEKEEEPKKGDAPPAEAKPEEDINAEHRAKIEALSKRLADQEAFINRQGNEIGELRKQQAQPPMSVERQEEVRERLAEAMQRDPVGTVNTLIAARERQSRDAITAEDRAREEKRIAHREVVMAEVPDMDDKVFAAIGDRLRARQVPEAEVQAFLKDPWVQNPLWLAAEGRLAKQEIENKELKAKIESLQSSENGVAEKIVKAAKKPPSITKTPGAKASSDGSEPPAITREMLAGLTATELANLSRTAFSEGG